MGQVASRVADASGRRVRVAPLTPDTWVDVEAVFGSKGDAAFCWCQFFRMQQAEWKASTREGNRQALCEQARRDRPPGLIAYADHEPVGWLGLGPRTAYARLMGNTRLGQSAAGDDLVSPSIWAVNCFVVRVGFRRKGIAAALLAAAPEFARAHGATVLEGHPVDVRTKPGKPSSADLYHGVVTTFEAAGYTEVARTGPTRPVMRLAL
jgi:GNAT superfamily N-acetyltransferase